MIKLKNLIVEEITPEEAKETFEGMFKVKDVLNLSKVSLKTIYDALRQKEIKKGNVLNVQLLDNAYEVLKDIETPPDDANIRQIVDDVANFISSEIHDMTTYLDIEVNFEEGLINIVPMQYLTDIMERGKFYIISYDSHDGMWYATKQHGQKQNLTLQEILAIAKEWVEFIDGKNNGET